MIKVEEIKNKNTKSNIQQQLKPTKVTTSIIIIFTLSFFA
jgi:hypothetical protein